MVCLKKIWAAFAIALLITGCSPGSDEAVSTDPGATLIVNARIIDGTGADARMGAVRIMDGHIVAVGDIGTREGDTVIDAGGLALAPGFIDTHSHHDDGLQDAPDAMPMVTQGITTIVIGQDGGSHYPMADFLAGLEAEPTAINVASYIGHNTLRRRVLGDDFRRTSSAEEIEAMRVLLESELKSGALGLSSGLEYDPGIYSDYGEVLVLARETAKIGGRYISHMRSEDRYIWDAVEEIISLGRDAGLPVQISHMKLAMKGLWGQAGRLIDRLDEARAQGVDITADIYPYEYWQSTMRVLLPERDFENRDSVAFALNELAPPDGIIFTRFEPDPSLAGKSIAEIADQRGVDPVTAYIELIREALAWEAENEGGAESVMGRSMSPEDIERLISWPHSNICSDGGYRGHPRGHGAFPRVLGRMSRDQGHWRLEEAVRKMTSLAAAHVGMAERGVIAEGAVADLVLFDADKIIDRATIENAQVLSEGVEKVWVSGVLVLERGEATGARPGKVIRRASNPPR